MPVSFSNADIRFTLKNKKALGLFIEKQFSKATKKHLKLSIVFCTDEYLLKINRQFLKHDTYTDIITFPLSENEKETEAEIYISIERVKENAAKLKIEFEEEVHRVMFHGVLHLLGFRDKSKKEKEVMRGRENAWLKNWERSGI